jgi:dihydroorotate dehydrogenase (NAD+) catalytic subunit
MAKLSVEVCGLRLANPTMLAAGVLDETGKTMQAVAKAGAGAIVTKSIGKEPRPGHPNPSVVELDVGLINAMGLPNPGVKHYSNEVRQAKKARVPIIGSVFGGTEEDISEVASAMANAGVDAIELNLSCPHAKGYGAEIGSTPERVESVCRAARKAVSVPIWAKLTPNTASISSLAKAAEAGGADAIVAINTVKGMAISPEARIPILAHRYGGLSGPAIRPIGVRCVFEIYESVKIPVIGVGGITTSRDALEYIMAGASAVQVGTAVWTNGIGVFRQICDGLSEFMEEYGYKSVASMVGVAHSARH